MNAITYAPRAANDGLLLTPLVTVEAVLAVTNVDEYFHPGVIALGLSGLCLFIVASWLGWSFGYTAMLIAVVTGLAGVYFGLLLHFGRSAAAFRGDITHRSFSQFVGGRVQILGGTVSGRDALIQIAFMPILLGITMMGFAVYWLTIRG
jgi:hypothetical protein